MSDVEVGSLAYGYLPIGTLPVDMEIQIDSHVPGQFIEVSKHREKLMPIYNRYRLSSAMRTAQEKQRLGYDSLFRVLFETGYMMNRFVFAHDPKESIHPFTADDGWTFADGQLGENATVVILSPSGKTALSFARQLRHGRPNLARPGVIVGIGSEASRSFTQSTGLYDQVLTYNEDPSALDLKPDAKIVLVDFGARGGAGSRWVGSLRSTHQDVTSMSVGGEVTPISNDEATKYFVERGNKAGAKDFRINASGLRSQAYDAIGIGQYFEDSEAAWEAWRGDYGPIEGLKLVWGDGMDGMAKGWARLCKGEVSAQEGLVYSLD